MEIIIGLMVTAGMCWALKTRDAPPIVVILASFLAGTSAATFVEAGAIDMDVWRGNILTFLSVSFVFWVFIHTLTGMLAQRRQ